MRGRRWRAMILITGTTLCALIAAVFVVSGWWSVWCRYPGLWVGIDSGDLMLVTDAELTRRLVEWGPLREGWSAHGHGFRLDWGSVSPSSSFSTVPLWVPFAAAAVPTLLVWRFWRKPPKPGHCRCGYDLTGLPEPRCPECGQPFEAKGDAP